MLSIDKDLKKILVVFFVYKILILSLGTVSYYMVPDDISHKNTELENPLTRPWYQFDTRAYMNIAEKGYNYEYGTWSGGPATTNFGWYPFYPFMIFLFGFAGHDIAAYLIPQIFSFLAVVMVYMLLKEDITKSQARKSVFYMLLFPAPYFLTALYTESIFLFLSAATFYMARKERWACAGIAGYFAVLTRFIGLAMFIPLLYMYIKRRGVNAKIAFIFLLPAAFVTIMAYHYFTFGDPLIQFYTQSQFSRGIGLPHTAFVNTIAEIYSTSSPFVMFYNWFNILTTLGFLALLVAYWRKTPLEYNLYVLLSFFMIFSSGILASVTRFELVLFPVFMAVSRFSERSRAATAAVAIMFSLFFLMQILAVVNHVNGEIDFRQLLKI